MVNGVRSERSINSDVITITLMFILEFYHNVYLIIGVLQETFLNRSLNRAEVASRCLMLVDAMLLRSLCQ